MEQEADIAERRDLLRSPKLWGAIAALVLLAIFIAENSQDVDIRFLFLETETPLIFGLLIAGILGFVIGWLAPIIRRGRRSR